MDGTQAYQQVLKLYNALSSREAKYVRNLNRYNSNGARREDIWTLYNTPQGYSQPSANSDGLETQINVIRSAVDTLVSKISQAKVRPFFNPVGGDWKTRKAARNAQLFFDAYYEDAGIYRKAIKTLRNAAIFDIGGVWWDDDRQNLEVLSPWEIMFDPAEWNYGRITQAAVYRRQFPLVAILDKIKDNPALMATLDKNRGQLGQYTVYYDLIDGERFDFWDGNLIREPKKLEFNQENGLYSCPVEVLFYSEPVKGFFSVSLADEIYTIQRQLDEMSRRIDSATRNGITNTIFVPTGSEIKASQLENGGGNIVKYTPGPDGGQPTVATPPAINGQFVEMLNLYEQKAYNMTGLSQLSAQGKKPAGVSSGVALQTLEDVESERFEVQLQSYIRFLVRIARMIINCSGDSLEVLPTVRGRAKVTWGQVRAQHKSFQIQFSAGSALAKDPATKLQQIEKLMEMGFLDKDYGASLLDMPDLESAYSSMTAALDNCEAIIEKAVEKGNTDFDPVVPLPMLMKEAVKTLNRLESVGEDEKILDRLRDLITKVEELQNPTPPPPPPVPPMVPPVVPGPGAPVMPAPLPPGALPPVNPPMGAISQGGPI